MNNRINLINEYHFMKIDELKKELVESGKEIIDLSIGDPDLPLHENIINAIKLRIDEKKTNQYPPYDGINELKKKIIDHYKKKYSIDLDMEEVLILIGSKEGLNNLIPAICDFNDLVLAPDLAYPVYEKCSLLWGCKTYKMKLDKENDYLPKLKEIPKEIKEQAKLMFINYPNNPTGAVATPEFYEEIIDYCSENNIVLCNDAAYMEIVSKGEANISLLQYDKDKRFLEMGSFSKTFNMSGLRIGYAVGNRDIIGKLLKIKSNVDSGQYTPIQYGAIEALNIYDEYIGEVQRIYDDRRNASFEILEKNGIEYYKSKGAFYIWCKTPNGENCIDYAGKLIKSSGIIITPGNCFGESYNEFFRIALTKEVDIIKRALEEIK